MRVINIFYKIIQESRIVNINNMDVKSDLKNIISENLAKVASSIFMVKSLSIIDESAESKESLLAAADKVSKRIALFIDADLATKVFDILRLEIENRELTPGIRRKHVRVAMRNKVYVTCNGTTSELYTVNVSAGGMYIRYKRTFPCRLKSGNIVAFEGGKSFAFKRCCGQYKP